MAKPTSARVYARRLGLRVAEGKTTGRVTFEQKDSPNEQHVRQLWLDVMHARTGEPPYVVRQPFEVVEQIIKDCAPSIWSDGDRSHLLVAGEKPEYPSDLYWPENQEQIMNTFRLLYDVRFEHKSSGKRAERKRKARQAELHDRDGAESNSPTIDHSYTGQTSRGGLQTSTSSNDTQPDDLSKIIFWLKDSAETFTAELILGQLSTIPTFFDAIKTAFLEQNPDPEDMARIQHKGEILRVKILVLNIGAGQHSNIQTLTTLKANNTDQTFARFREALASGFKRHRHESETVICLGTVLFHADQRLHC